MTRLTPLPLLATLNLFTGCSPAEPPGPGGGEVAQSDKQRLLAPSVAPADLSTQVKGNTAFAANLYQKVRAEPGNLFYSPYSISLALAMLYGGARGVTESEMATSLHLGLPQDRLHPVFNKIDLELASRGQGKKAADGKAFRLNVVNATWGQRGYSFLPDYLDLLAVNYGAGLRLLDFETQPEPSRATINQWVEHKTESRIKDLLPEGSITDLTRLVLTNAIYFNAAWATAFEPSATTTRTFTRLDGAAVQVPMMSGEVGSRYFKGSGVQAAAVPYDGGELDMVVVLPDAGTFASFEQSLTSAVIEDVLDKLAGQPVRLQLPRFEFTSSLGLREVLEAMGMKSAFTAQADLSGINGKRTLSVSDVLHKAFIKVNEAGTEAAAATAVIVGNTSAPPPPVELNLDRPFFFFIVDGATRTVIFVGRVLDPA